jgi:hypothetical protein
MTVRPTYPAVPLTLAEMELLVSRTGLDLNPGQMADLVLAWRHLSELIGRLPRDRPLLGTCNFISVPPPPPAEPRVAPLPAKRAPVKPDGKPGRKSARKTGRKLGRRSR